MGVGELVPIEQYEIGGLADRERADMAAIGCGRGTACRRHAQYLARARDVLVRHPRDPVRAQYHAHLLQYVAIVVDPGFVQPDRGVDAALFERVQRCHPAAQPEIRAAVMADMGAGRGDAVEIASLSHTPWPNVSRGPRKPKRPM